MPLLVLLKTSPGGPGPGLELLTEPLLARPHAVHVVLVRNGPGDRRALLLPHDVELDRLTGLIRAQDPHRMLGRRRLAAVNRNNDITALEWQRRIGRRLHDQHAFTRAEVIAEIG